MRFDITKMAIIAAFVAGALMSWTKTSPAETKNDERVARALERIVLLMERSELRGGREVVCKCDR